MIGPSFSDLGL